MNDLTMTTNELVTLNDNDVPTTTSLIVAEAFAKRHDHVMDAVKLIIHTLESNNLNAPNFRVVKYKDKKGELRPMYEMDRNAYTQLVGSFKGEKSTIFRKRYADAFDAMEAALVEKEQAQAFDPTKLSKMEILKMALESESERLRLEHRVAEDAPKVAAYHDLIQSDGSVQLQDAGKILDVKPKLFIEWLRENAGYLFYKQGRNAPYQYYVDRGLFEVKVDVYPQKDGSMLAAA